MFDLTGQVAVVTGASSGLGKQMARGFAKQGANLVIMARRIERLEEFKKELEKEYKIKVLALKCDVTSTENINECAAAVEKKFKRVDILVNCAGSSKDKGVLDMNDEEWDFTIDTDLTSVFKMTRAFAAIMKKNNYGRIINIASMYGMVGHTEIPTIAYHSSNKNEYGKMKVYTFAKDSNIVGPMQLDNQIDQNSEISKDLSLWSSGGSSIIRSMVVVPVGNTLIYVDITSFAHRFNKSVPATT